MGKLVILPFLFLLISFTPCQSLPLQATSLLTNIQKDHTTLQYIITLFLQTPLKRTRLLLDLGATFSWVNCDNYTSSTYKHIPCDSPLADLLGQPACLVDCPYQPGPNCANNVCLLLPENPIKPINFAKADPVVAALVDTFALPSLVNTPTQVGPLAFINNFIFSCARTSYLTGLAKGVSGLAALGRSNVSIPVQFSDVFSSSPHCFAMCLSGSKSKPGVAIFGSRGPYIFLPGSIDLSRSLIYTPLLLNPVGKDSEFKNRIPSAEYFIGLTSIKVNGKLVALNQSLLAINGDNGSGGTKISTVVPYTKLETSIYKVFIGAFLKEAASSAFNLTTTTKPVKPFKVCYPASAVKTTQMGPAVPTIELVLGGKEVIWKIFGSNSMVRIIKKGGVNMWCLGYVDGGVNERRSSWIGDASIVIGGHQLEDNMLQFDLQSMKLGFSYSILSKGTNCASFKSSSTKKV